MSAQKVLVIGGGGREHAISWALAKSERVERIYVAPGNHGISTENKVTIADINVKSNKEIAEWCKKENINLVVVGPENFLADGLSDELNSFNIPCFGPGKLAARIETDKNWSKFFMDRHHIPTAKWKSFTDAEEAKNFIKEAPFKALVVKASGLAAGKGVVVASDAEEACQAIDEMMVDKKYGSAGDTIVIEELLEGEEVSLLAFTDGTTVVEMLPAQDHKRIFDGDKGANTGGMGAYCPCPLLSQEDLDFVKANVLQRAVDGLRSENISFVGVLYAGLMLTADGPKVLEFNCRFGDPETQVVLPLLKSDLFDIMEACCKGTLSPDKVVWHQHIFAVGVILASRGYPETSSKGQVITGVDYVKMMSKHFVFHSGTAISESGELVTNGGRVLIAVRLHITLPSAAAEATNAARHIDFDGKQFRSDIAQKGIARSILSKGRTTYKSSGVDISAGDALVSAIKPLIKETKRTGTLGNIGGFGGLFETKAAGYKDPILVSGTDGVGTKLKIAIECNKHDTVGIDLVAMCVNDILAHGAEPLFFLDYFACGKLDVDVATQVITGIVEGCKQAGCSLVGGETAEMPEMYKDGEYDLAGFAVGAVERDKLLPRPHDMRVNDIVIGLPSTGVHSNGFSLVRKVIKKLGLTFSDAAPFSEKNGTIGEELLVPTKIYTKSVGKVLNANLIKGFAHITGGGLTENVPRVLPDHMGVLLDASHWNILPIFGWLSLMGEISKQEMLRTFNCGIGAILICSPNNRNLVCDMLKDENPVVIGTLKHCRNDELRVEVHNFENTIELGMRKHVPHLIQHLSKPRRKVGVLISGSGTNLQALIDATQNDMESIGAEIVIVISNKENVEGLKRAERAGIATKVIKHTAYPDRESFDTEVDKELRNSGVEIVCLAGFMRILSEFFVRRWKGALLNVHPSLLPSFKGAHAHRDVLKAGVRVSGCTVHFVEPEIDSGAIIEQGTVPVLPTDTIETLQERVKTMEHQVFPLALKHLATGRIELKEDNTIQWKW